MNFVNNEKCVDCPLKESAPMDCFKTFSKECPTNFEKENGFYLIDGSVGFNQEIAFIKGNNSR